MLTLAVKAKGSLSFESIQSQFDYLVVTYMGNKRIYHREPSLSMIHVTAHYTPISAVRLDNSLKGFLLFSVSQEEAKELKAAELMTGCLKSALIHLVNGLEEHE